MKTMRSKFKVCFRDLLCPENFPYPLTVEQAMETFRFMVASASGYREMTRWGDHGPIECLSMTSGIGLSSVGPLRSLDDLKQRFVAAFFSRHGGGATEKWRAEHKVHPDEMVWVYAPHFTPFEPTPFFSCEGDTGKALGALFSTTGTLTACPNPFHHSAVEVNAVTLHVHDKGFLFVLDYGYDGSRWDLTLARTEPGEPFTGTLSRAARNMTLLMDTACVAERRIVLLNETLTDRYHMWKVVNGIPVLEWMREPVASAA